MRDHTRSSELRYTGFSGGVLFCQAKLKLISRANFGSRPSVNNILYCKRNNRRRLSAALRTWFASENASSWRGCKSVTRITVVDFRKSHRRYSVHEQRAKFLLGKEKKNETKRIGSHSSFYFKVKENRLKTNCFRCRCAGKTYTSQ